MSPDPGPCWCSLTMVPKDGVSPSPPSRAGPGIGLFRREGVQLGKEQGTECRAHFFPCNLPWYPGCWGAAGGAHLCG